MANEAQQTEATTTSSKNVVEMLVNSNILLVYLLGPNPPEEGLQMGILKKLAEYGQGDVTSRLTFIDTHREVQSARLACTKGFKSLISDPEGYVTDGEFIEIVNQALIREAFHARQVGGKNGEKIFLVAGMPRNRSHAAELCGRSTQKVKQHCLHLDISYETCLKRVLKRHKNGGKNSLLKYVDDNYRARKHDYRKYEMFAVPAISDIRRHKEKMVTTINGDDTIENQTRRLILALGKIEALNHRSLWALRDRLSDRRHPAHELIGAIDQEELSTTQ